MTTDEKHHRLRRLAPSRTTSTMVLAVLMVLGAGALRNDGITGLSERAYWANKFEFRRCAEVVVAGDSRIQTAIAPSEMSPRLGNLRVRNFGFEGVGWSNEYLDAVEGVLDPKGQNPIIILGVSPHTFSPSSAILSGFTREKQYAARRNLLDNAMRDAVAFFEPMSIKNALRKLFFIKTHERYRYEYTRDGWAATVRTKPDPTLSLEAYRNVVFRNNTFKREIMRNLLDRVRRWRAQGIVVFALCPPTTEAMIAVEREVSGFDQDAFVVKFQAAGGVWLDFTGGEYDTYDGSHLDRPSAERFSRDLADAVRRSLSDG